MKIYIEINIDHSEELEHLKFIFQELETQLAERSLQIENGGNIDLKSESYTLNLRQ